MVENPYESPQASHVPDSQNSDAAIGRDIAAVILGGFFVDSIGSVVARVAILLFVIFTTDDPAIADGFHVNPPGWAKVAGLAACVLTSGLGGLVAALIASRKPILHAFISWLIARLFCNLPVHLNRKAPLDWRVLLLVFLSLFAALAAGALVRRRNAT